MFAFCKFYYIFAETQDSTPGTLEPLRLTRSVRERLTQALTDASKADKAIANCILTELATVPIETATG